LDAVLSKLGVNMRDELDEYIRKNMKNDADLRAYDKLRERYVMTLAHRYITHLKIEHTD